MQCFTDTFRIFAQGRRTGLKIFHRDYVMIGEDIGKYIQGTGIGTVTRFSTCSNNATYPPSDSSYTHCPEAVFRIHKIL